MSVNIWKRHISELKLKCCVIFMPCFYFNHTWITIWSTLWCSVRFGYVIIVICSYDLYYLTPAGISGCASSLYMNFNGLIRNLIVSCTWSAIYTSKDKRAVFQSRESVLSCVNINVFKVTVCQTCACGSLLKLFNQSCLD